MEDYTNLNKVFGIDCPMFLPEEKEENIEYFRRATPVNAGHPHSEETKHLLRIANLGKKHTDATKDKCRAASYRRKTYGSRPIGYKHKKESKDKMSKTYKLTWENGSSVVVTNLDEWCRQNGYQRRNLTYVKHGKRRQHKGIVDINIIYEE